ncbi:hypothetical protein [Rhodococcus sp. NPDC047139]|uniref:hypothetical protein n=1 Tax=Rhodococcus sp. NPDC047139 TaxID=3155141 RepID=UPI0033E7AE37
MASDAKILARVRAIFVCAMSVTLSIAAHAFAGGAVPHQDIVVLLLGVAVISGVLAAETRVPVPLLLVLGQVVGHLVLGLHDGHLHTPALGMLLAHLGAVAVAAVLVQGAETGCGVAFAALRRLLPRLYRALPVAVAEPAPTGYRLRIGPGLLLVGGSGCRAPPTVLR